jgi:CheY-like chemotaxis protein
MGEGHQVVGPLAHAPPPSAPYSGTITTTRIRVLMCEASSADEAVEKAAALAPNVVVMDVRMPGRSGVEACRDIRAAREETRLQRVGWCER